MVPTNTTTPPPAATTTVPGSVRYSQPAVAGRTDVHRRSVAVDHRRSHRFDPVGLLRDPLVGEGPHRQDGRANDIRASATTATTRLGGDDEDRRTTDMTTPPSGPMVEGEVGGGPGDRGVPDRPQVSRVAAEQAGAELEHGLAVDLADPALADAEDRADLGEGHRLVVVEAEHRAFALGQRQDRRAENATDLAGLDLGSGAELIVGDGVDDRQALRWLPPLTISSSPRMPPRAT